LPHTWFSAIEGTTTGPLRARFALSVHGETTEVVRGREKLHRASFVLALQLENVGSDALSLHAPAIDATAPFAVRRWYVLGEAGRPWSGALSPGQRIRVNVIGDLGDPMKPGARVTAAVRLGSLHVPLTTPARGRWNEREHASAR
jgi:hypothetical protein